MKLLVPSTLKNEKMQLDMNNVEFKVNLNGYK